MLKNCFSEVFETSNAYLILLKTNKLDVFISFQSNWEMLSKTVTYLISCKIETFDSKFGNIENLGTSQA